jgi:hypothetical protein
MLSMLLIVLAFYMSNVQEKPSKEGSFSRAGVNKMNP